jgi:hypothetical protein
MELVIMMRRLAFAGKVPIGRFTQMAAEGEDMSPAPTAASSSRRAEITQHQGRKIQREIDAVEVGASNDRKKKPKAMRAGSSRVSDRIRPAASREARA